MKIYMAKEEKNKTAPKIISGVSTNINPQKRKQVVAPPPLWLP
jgi:hypothetical protein